jgi:hypothetical protein
MGFVYSSVLDNDPTYHRSQQARAEIFNYEEFLIAYYLYKHQKNSTKLERTHIVAELRKSPGEIFEFFDRDVFPLPDDPDWEEALEAIGVMSAFNPNEGVIK